MLTLAVPEPAAALMAPDVMDAVAVTDGVAATVDSLSVFLLEQPDKPATTIAALPTPTNKPRTTGVSFHWRKSLDSLVMPVRSPG